MMEQNNPSLREILTDCTTQQLDDMLQAELHNQPIDEAAVRMIMSVLAEREAEHPVDVNEEIARAWEKYQSDRDGAQGQAPSKRVIRWNWTVKAASVLLVLGIAASFLSQEVNAEAFLDKIARWSESIFELFSPDEPNDNEIEYVFKTGHPGLQQVYDTVTELGVTQSVVPMYFPDDLELVELKQEAISKAVGIVAVFSGIEGNTVLRIDIYEDDVSSEYHKDQSDVTIFEKSGITHYLMNNNDTYTVVWANQNVECLISTNCQESVLRRILKSIYITEGE